MRGNSEDQLPDLREGFCTSYHRGVELIGRRWNGVILRELLLGARRFSEIRRGIPALTDRMLASRLRELEAEGIVTRVVYDETPVRVEYELTEMGRDLEQAVAALNRWASRWLPED
ncbi:winged helix-turn-helix transcriptional regulator [Sciscionella sediminilitoris]|uniref:winged helix-turn-helix transcriptional regulator n=1 Tax=Sciscionella sediminilitoris TaxID=1445613 RepID=UPI000AD24F55|nr:winged helix-turn-helix transcriptional regulator [Sciscionella sp. SE31]